MVSELNKYKFSALEIFDFYRSLKCFDHISDETLEAIIASCEDQKLSIRRGEYVYTYPPRKEVEYIVSENGCSCALCKKVFNKDSYFYWDFENKEKKWFHDFYKSISFDDIEKYNKITNDFWDTSSRIPLYFPFSEVYFFCKDCAEELAILMYERKKPRTLVEAIFEKPLKVLKSKVKEKTVDPRSIQKSA